MRLRPLLIALAPVVLLAAGCGAKKINETKTLTLDKEVTARSLILPVPKKATKVTVEFSSSAGDVYVLAFKTSDLKSEADISSAASGKALDKKRGKADSFTVDVPEGTEVQIIVREHTAAKTDVTVKVVEQ